jgi:amino-acid N-acetyltransferase
MNSKPQSPISCQGGLVLDADKADPAEPPKATGCCGTGGATNRIQSCRSSVGPTASAAPTELETAVTITRASAEDLGGVLSLLESLQLPTAGVADHYGNFFVAKEKDGRLAGAIGLERYGTFGLLRSAAVAPRLKKSGIGSKLTRLLIDFAKAQGLTDLVLFTPTARDFFARFGFVAANPENYCALLKASSQWGDCSCRNSAEFMRLGLRSDTSLRVQSATRRKK